MDSLDKTEGIAIHTGFPNPATDASLQSLDLHKLLVPNGASTYLMRIEGDEWRADGIFAGDIVLIDRSLNPRVTDLVVWWYQDEFAISVQTRMPQSATVWGVVTATIHQFRKRELKP